MPGNPVASRVPPLVELVQFGADLHEHATLYPQSRQVVAVPAQAIS